MNLPQQIVCVATSLLMIGGSVSSICAQTAPVAAAATSLGTHGFAPSGDVRIHYVTQGEGPLVVLVHGFPDFWYTWRRQMPALAERYQVVAIDQRGYNQSSQPEGVEQYAMEKLTGDVEAVIRHFERDRAVVVGHDWGGAVAWSFAMARPEMTDRLVILNLPHPRGLLRELANNPQQRENSGYARAFQQPDAADKLTAEGLASWVREEADRRQYVEAFRRSSFAGMLNYYQANYPREPYRIPEDVPPKVRCPVLMFHGLKDKALLPGALNDTWDWLDAELTLVTVPNADHWVHHDAPDLVTRTMMDWLSR